MEFTMIEERTTKTYEMTEDNFTYRVYEELDGEVVRHTSMNIQKENGEHIGSINKSGSIINLNITFDEDLMKHYNVFCEFVSNQDEIEIEE